MGRNFIINEETLEKVREKLEMTPDRFNSNIRYFLHQLMSDPVNAQPTFALKENGLTRAKLLYYLKKFNVIERHDRVSDKDENGEYKDKATMKVSFTIKGKIDDEEEYRVPRNNFDRKIEKMRRYIFEKNLPKREFRKLPVRAQELDEEGGGATSASACNASAPVQPIFGKPISRTIYEGENQESKPRPGRNFVISEEQLEKIKEATATTTVGDYQYTVPFGANPNDPTMKRHDGVGGSHSIEIANESKEESTVTGSATWDAINDNPGLVLHPKDPSLRRDIVHSVDRIQEAVTGEDAVKCAAIYAYCKDAKDEDWCVLCAKRLEGDEKGKWNPPMGHLHVGESPKDGAVRECEEESGVKIPIAKLKVGSNEDWGRNYVCILDGTVKDWPVGEGDEENTKFVWKNVYSIFHGKDKDLPWAWSCKDFVARFAPAELDLDESKQPKRIISESKNSKYVNMNVELRKGGRNAVRMSVEDFKEEMKNAYHQYAIEQGKKYKSELQPTPRPGNFVYSLCYGSKTNKDSKYASALYDDIWNGKYKFDSENVDAHGDIKMSKKGFPYIQCAAGGDWECPVCFFVYFDGNKFRGYVPLKGNALNRVEKHAFSGSRNEDDAKFVQKELGINYDEANSMCGDINYNLEACLEDFLSRVDVNGSYKKRDLSKNEEKFKKYRDEKISQEKRESEEAERTRQENAQLNEKRKKVIKNDEGKVVPETCPKCGGKVHLELHGEPVYLCSDCGEYYGTMPFKK